MVRIEDFKLKRTKGTDAEVSIIYSYKGIIMQIFAVVIQFISVHYPRTLGDLLQVSTRTSRDQGN